MACFPAVPRCCCVCVSARARARACVYEREREANTPLLLRPAGLADREYKRNTLLEVMDYADTSGRSLFADVRVLEDTFTMVRLNLFRALPRAPAPSGDPDEEEVRSLYTPTSFGHACCLLQVHPLLPARFFALLSPPSPQAAFSDPTWPYLSIVYELLLRLVSMDHIDLTLRKRVIDPTFVRQLLLLFDSEDPREVSRCC